VAEQAACLLKLELELPQFTGHFDLLEQGHRLL
jgi:hypothetical protein